MLAEARRLLGELDAAVRLVQRRGRGAVRRLAVGFVPSASNAAAGSGVALVPESAQALARRGVVYPPLRGGGAERAELVAVWHAESRAPVLCAFLGRHRHRPADRHGLLRPRDARRN